MQGFIAYSLAACGMRRGWKLFLDFLPASGYPPGFFWFVDGFVGFSFFSVLLLFVVVVVVSPCPE